MKILSLCSGVGGAELALQQSDIDAEIVGYAEIDNKASSVYQKHFPNHKNFGDIEKIDPKVLPDFDMLIAGFPCQSFSIAGKLRGFEDTRGTIFFDIARILEEKKPEYFLLENVKNLISHDKGNTFKTIISILQNMEYYIRWDVLNSKDFGVPQNRERIFIRGSLKNNLGDISLTTADVLFGDTLTKLEKEIVNRKIKARVHKVDVKGLKRKLRASKKKCGYTNQQIANELDIPITQVEHYFRNDDSFSIPQADIWYQLKEMLQIDTNEFDAQITEFEIKDSVFDQTKRCYKDTGISPTITCGGEVLIHQTRIRQLNGKDFPQAMKVYDPNGLSVTQVANGGGMGAKTGLYEVNKSLKIATATKKGYDEVYPGDGIRLDHPGSKTGRGRTQKEGVGTLTCNSNWGVVDNQYRIRRLIPLEMERLQGFPDNWTEKGYNGEKISDTQRYKMMGNAFTVSVVKYILNNFYEER